MISLDNCSGSCNFVYDLSTKICVPSETRDMNVKVLNMITNENEAKAMAKNISCDCKCNLNSTTLNSNQKWNNEKCQCECKKYRSCKNDYSWNPSTCICEKRKHWKRIVDDSVIAYDEIIYQQTWQTLYQQIWPILYQQMCQQILMVKKVRYKIDCYIACSFISDHITSRYYLLPLCKTYVITKKSALS